MRSRTKVVLATTAVVILSVATVVPALTQSTVKVGTALPPGARFTTAAAAFAPLDAKALVPPNVLDALPLPRGSVPTVLRNLDQGKGVFDRSVTFRTMMPYQTLSKAYPVAFHRDGWVVLSVSRPHSGSGVEVLAKKAGADGFYWEAGAVIPQPGTPGASSPARFTLRLFQVQEA